MVMGATFLPSRGHGGPDPTAGGRLSRRALIIASLRDARSDPFAVDETWLLPSVAWWPPPSPPVRPATEGRWIMPVSHLAKATFDHARRRTALGLFRLASLILRRATDRFQRRWIARVHLRVALAAAKLLERCGGVLLLGISWTKDQPDRGRKDTS
jgi:hypothetical protein